MFKTLSCLLILTLSASAFQIKTEEIEVSTTVRAIPWPFTSCGEGSWTIESLTLDQTPKRNINDNIVMVHIPIIADWNCQSCRHF